VRRNESIIFIFLSWVQKITYLWQEFFQLITVEKEPGLAVTDPMQIIASGLTAVDTKDLVQFLKKYLQEEAVELIIIGEPKNWDDSDTHATPLVNAFIKKLA
jgi:RNase H-fold protein (predicted Holliday junction resolvase)